MANESHGGERVGPPAELRRQPTGPGPWGSSVAGAGRRKQEGTPLCSFTVNSRVLPELTLLWFPRCPPS